MGYVHKTGAGSLKDIYKALHTIGKLRERNALAQQNVLPCLDAVGSMHKLTAIENETVLVKHFQALLHAVNTMQLERYVKRDFSDVSEKYIKA
jgi:hypothetical protein